jgi:hypothetical protein
MSRVSLTPPQPAAPRAEWRVCDPNAKVMLRGGSGGPARHEPSAQLVHLQQPVAPRQRAAASPAATSTGDPTLSPADSRAPRTTTPRTPHATDSWSSTVADG